MSRFSRNEAREVTARKSGWPRRRLPEREESATAQRRGASEWKHFVLAAAALIGLAIGWLSGKAISGLLPASRDVAVAERAAPAANPTPRDDAQSTQPPATSQQAAPDDVQEAAAATGEGAGASVAQATNDEPERAGRRAVRHPRRARGQFFFKPFKVFRKLKIW